MSKKILLSAVILMTAFIAACQPNPTLINSTVQPRDNRQTANHNGMNHGEMNHSTTHGDSTNTNAANSGMPNANSTNHSETKPESRTNTGN